MNCGGAALWQGQLYCVAGAVFVFSCEFFGRELLGCFLPEGSPCLLLHSTVYLVLKQPTLQGSLSLVYALPHTGTLQGAGRAGAGGQVRVLRLGTCLMHGPPDTSVR